MENKDDVHLVSLLKCLIECSEKASRIAQICRSDKELFSLLVQEKSATEKNMRFVQDFKTLADVLVQETVRWNVSKKFPPLRSNIFGEENNHFENTLGESIEVCITDSSDETESLLSVILDGRTDSAKALAEGIYADVEIHVDVSEIASNLYLPGNSIGIWIDPIDSTGEYVHAENEDSCDQLSSSGLKCVCVLIGVYMLNTGHSIMGVINQPFFARSSTADEWMSKYFWAICHEGICESSFFQEDIPVLKNKLVISSCEDEELLQIIKSKYSINHVAGAGYKSLLVACGDVDLYVLSCPTTYLWDTCGPHALLTAVGGGMINFKNAITTKDLTIDSLASLQLKYNANPPANGKMYCNTGGVIAYRNAECVIEFLQHLLESGYVSK